MQLWDYTLKAALVMKVRCGLHVTKFGLPWRSYGTKSLAGRRQSPARLLLCHSRSSVNNGKSWQEGAP